MSAVAGLVPKIEGFQPIPNAVMIPFMETQSAALAFGFGLNYEYGKRTIRSMSNETFNSLTSEQVAEMSAQHSTVLLNRFIQAVPQVMPAQTEIFKQYVEIEKLKVLQNVQLAKWIATNAPSIIVTGKTASTDIRTTPETQPPSTTSSDATSISQDSSGKVTTTTRLAYPTRPDQTKRHSYSNVERNKVITHYNSIIKQLSDSIVAYIPRINNQNRRKNVAAFTNGGFPFPDHSVLRQLYLSLIQQKQFLLNVLAGVVPF